MPYCNRQYKHHALCYMHRFSVSENNIITGLKIFQWNKICHDDSAARRNKSNVSGEVWCCTEKKQNRYIVFSTNKVLNITIYLFVSIMSSLKNTAWCFCKAVPASDLTPTQGGVLYFTHMAATWRKTQQLKRNWALFQKAALVKNMSMLNPR